MFKRVLDSVMERRARQLIDLIAAWLPPAGPVLDLGSGTGHVAFQLEQDHRLDVVTADVTDIHIVGPRPVPISDGALPFADGTFSATLLLFMLAYPKDPARLLSEVARVTRGPIIIVQTLHANRIGYAWLRVREFVWTVVAFHASKLVGYVPPEAKFSMNTRRFYTAHRLREEVQSAGLRIRSQRERPVLPGRSLVVTASVLESAFAPGTETRAIPAECDA